MSDSAPQSPSGPSGGKRRSFLFGSGLLAGGAALLSLAPKATPSPTQAAEATAPSSGGYRDGERARRYYDSARI